MPPTLPSPIARDLVALGMFLIAACGSSPPPVAPGPPIAADPVVALRSMQEECDAMVGALTTYKACPNLEQEDQRDLDSWIESATKSFEAGNKANPEVNAQKAIAAACHRATTSVEAATQRCLAGPRPKDQ